MAINKKFKRYNGTAWEEYYFHAFDSEKLGGQLPSFYAADSDLNNYLPLIGGTLTGKLTVPTLALTQDASNTSDHRISVYDGGDTSYGMMLWNSNGTSGDWSTMIYGPNQSSRRISFGKINNTTFTTHEDVNEIAYFDLDDSSLNLDGNIKIGNSNTLSNEGFELNGTASVGLRATNANGYVSITPLNTGWAHIYTDRSNFIFNKPVYSVDNTFSSYNNDLILERASTEKLRLTSTQAEFVDNIKTSGKIGIGINPTSPLHIQYASASTEMAEGMITLENTTTSGESAIRFINGAVATTGNSWYAGLNNDNTFRISYGTANTNANTRLAVSPTGTVTANIFSGSLSGNATTASSLQTARSISLIGDVTGSTTFDGSGNVSITATVADDSHNHIISNIDDLQTELDSKLNTSGGTISGNLIVSGNLTINGTQTILNTSTLEIDDPMIVINGALTGDPDTIPVDSGLEVERGTGTNKKFYWSESNDKWQLTDSGDTVRDVYHTGNLPTYPTVNNGTITISAGSGLTSGGSFTTNQSANETITLNHADTSTQSSLSYTGTTVIQSIALDTYGHITSMSGKALSLSDFGVLATSTELNYTTNVTSDIQSQLDGKVPTSRTINGTALTTDITLNAGDVGAATDTHTHGNVANDGTITTGVSASNLDRIVITDSTDGNKIKVGPTFGTSTTQYLRNDGAWVTPPDTNTDTNNYVTGVSGSGDGILTLTRSGLSNLTADLSHSHSEYDNYGQWNFAAYSSTGSPKGTSAITSGDTAILKEGAGITLTASTDTITIDKDPTVRSIKNFTTYVQSDGGQDELPVTETLVDGDIIGIVAICGTSTSYNERTKEIKWIRLGDSAPYYTSIMFSRYATSSSTSYFYQTEIFQAAGSLYMNDGTWTTLTSTGNVISVVPATGIYIVDILKMD